MRDSDVRVAVRRKLKEKFGTDPNSRIVEEMGIWSGSVRVDLAVINGELWGYELKSDRDTLARLPFQADLYSRVFDRIELVVGSKHACRAAEIVPCWWKITVATMSGDTVNLTPMLGYPGSRNPNPEPYLVAQLLWKDEALAVLDSYAISKGWRSKRIKEIHEHLASSLAFDTLSLEVRQALRRRPEHWLGQQMPDQFDVAVNTNLDPVL